MMDFRTDRSKVSGFGSAKDGTDHWWQQRLSSMALVPLTLVFVFQLIPQFGMNQSEIVELYRNPMRAILTILFLGVTFTHLQQGLQVVIEDYIHGKKNKIVLVVLNIFFCWGIGLIGIFSVIKIVFSF